jgi:hypothetical protein
MDSERVGEKSIVTILITIIKNAYYYYNLQSDILCMDFKLAYGCIHRQSYINITTEGIPSKGIRLMRMIFEESETRVFIENNITESFNINVAMRQVDALLVILFNLALVRYIPF